MATQVTLESRRGVLRAFVVGAVGALAAGLGGVLGRFAVVPRAKTEEQWFRAAALSDLDANIPHAAIVAVPRTEGWSRTRVNEVVYVVWDGLFKVRALSATCTHLGCRVRWDAGGKKFKCPCHGGTYSADGKVLGGPPPRPLAVLQARITDAGDVEVRL
jgi:Rieske Fe-S protein